MSYTKEQNRIMKKVRRAKFLYDLMAGRLKCAKCGRSAGRLELNHKRPLKDGGSLTDSDNLEWLCREHHFEETARQSGKKINKTKRKWKLFLKELV